MYPLKINEKYDSSQLQRLSGRFTTAYLGNYISGDFREGVGSHVGVDIKPVTPAQDVLAVLAGTVLKAGTDGAYGNFVIIEHAGVPDPDNFSATTTLYSCYLHLSALSTTAGAKVNEGTVIGKTGNSGNSYGEHLHFQIDRKEAPYHAYWPFTGEEAKQAGTDFMGATNKGLGLDKAKKFTVNPLVYLDKLSARGGGNPQPQNVAVNTPPLTSNSPQAKPATSPNVATPKPTPSAPQVAKVIRKDAEIIS